MKCIYLSVTFFLPLLCWSQSILKGRIVDAETQQGLQYVNIGILGKSIGTVSNANGDFQLEIKEALYKETLRISSIGYETLNGTVGNYVIELKRNPTLSLKTKLSTLEEVVLTHKPKKRKRIGNKNVSSFVTYSQPSLQLGNETGVIINVRKKTSYIESFNAVFFANTYGNVKFRINFYNLKDGMPHELILKENIIFETDIKSGLLEVDLKPYDLVIDEDLFVSLELIETLENKKGVLTFNGKLFGTDTYLRNTSHDIWIKTPLQTSIGFSMTVLQ